jgi:hypothetical protein
MAEWIPDDQMVSQEYLPGGPDQALRPSEEEKARIIEEETKTRCQFTTLLLLSNF